MPEASLRPRFDRYAIEKGHTIIKYTVVDSAVGQFLARPNHPTTRWVAAWTSAGIDRDKMQVYESVLKKDLMGSTLSGMMTEIVEEKPQK